MKRVDENPPSRFPGRAIDQAEQPWWIAKLRPRQEKAMAWDLMNAGIEYYLPLYTKVIRRQDNNKPRKSIMPLFPGYISFALEPERRHELYKKNRLVNIIEVRHQKRFVRELSQIYLSLELGIEMEPLETFEEGETVEVFRGPLRGIRGDIIHVRDADKLVLSVEGLGRAAIKVDAALVKSVEE